MVPRQTTSLFSLPSERGKSFQALNKLVVGMNPGELKTIVIPADHAFGPHLDEMVVAVDRTQLPEDFNPKVGEQVQFRQPDGQIVTVLVTDVSESSVTIDANHPLAGKDLTFDIQFLEIV